MNIAIGQKPPQRRSIVMWGAAAAAAVISSYLLTLVLAAACLAMPAVVIWNLAQGNTTALSTQLLLGIFGLVAGPSILWALIPRKIPFEAPGATIDLSRERRLNEEIKSIADALDEPMPTEVYLIADANAFVSQPGGGRKVLAIGLPLLQTLTVFELRAILAHEFAHFYSGDTRLGPWVYRGRATMVRVFENLGKKSEVMGILTRWAVVGVVYMALIWFLRTYWKLFLRLTQMISRRQEFRSDEIACYVAGSDSMASALEAVNRTSAVVRPYWQNVVFPLAARGYHPQIASSFGQFLAQPGVAKAAAEFLEKRVGSTKSDPFDTHPPLGARIAEAKKIGVAAPAADAEYGNRPAVSLLEDLSGLECELLRGLMPQLKTAELRPLVWETSGVEVFVPMWRKEVEPFAEILATVTLRALPMLVKNPRILVERVTNPPGLLLNKEKKMARALEIVRMALTLSLIDHGWLVHIGPGSCYLEHDGVQVVAANVVGSLKSGAMQETQWDEFCTKMGVGDLPLGASTAQGSLV